MPKLSKALPKHYVKNGQITDEVDCYKSLVRRVKELYGPPPAADFGPKQMKAVRARMIAADNSRPYINKQMIRLRHLFKWAAAEELVPVDVYHRLAVVPGLQKGKGEARDPEPVGPVDDAVVDATIPFLRPVVSAMVRFQRLTGARPDEVCRMRPRDIDRTGDVWRYVLESHKTEHHGRGRTIFIGPQAQEVLRPYLFGDDLPCFRAPTSPVDSKGIKLETLSIGGRRLTSQEALQRFIERMTAVPGHLHPMVRPFRPATC